MSINVPIIFIAIIGCCVCPPPPGCPPGPPPPGGPPPPPPPGGPPPPGCPPGHPPPDPVKMCDGFKNRTQEELDEMDKMIGDHEKCFDGVYPTMKASKEACYKDKMGTDSMPEKPSDAMKKMCEDPKENGPKMHEIMKCAHQKVLEEEQKKDPKMDEHKMMQTMHEKCGPPHPPPKKE